MSKEKQKTKLQTLKNHFCSVKKIKFYSSWQLIVSCHFLCMFQIWGAHHMFKTADDAETYLGVLDAVFMVSYAVVGLTFSLMYVLILCQIYTVVFMCHQF